MNPFQGKFKGLLGSSARYFWDCECNENGCFKVKFFAFESFHFRFRMSEPLRNITVFVESKGYSLDTHRIWTSDVPKKNVVCSFGSLLHCFPSTSPRELP